MFRNYLINIETGTFPRLEKSLRALLRTSRLVAVYTAAESQSRRRQVLAYGWQSQSWAEDSNLHALPRGSVWVLVQGERSGDDHSWENAKTCRSVPMAPMSELSVQTRLCSPTNESGQQPVVLGFMAAIWRPWYGCLHGLDVESTHAFKN